MRLSLSTATLLLLPSCALPFPAWEPLDDSLLARELSDSFPDQHPSSRLTIRAIMSLDGMDLPLTLRVLRLSPDKLRVIAMEDLGGTLFHFVGRGDAIEVIASAAAIPPEVLSRGVAEEMALWLLFASQDGDTAVRIDSDRAGLLREHGDRHILFWSSTGSAFDHIADGRNGRLRREFDLEWDGDRPATARITNHEFSYTMDLEVLQWQPADLAPDDFRTDR